MFQPPNKGLFTLAEQAQKGFVIAALAAGMTEFGLLIRSM